MEVYLIPVKYCKTPTGHPKGYPCCKIADYDDTAFGAGTLTGTGTGEQVLTVANLFMVEEDLAEDWKRNWQDHCLQINE